jgi:hypothetical protein
MFVQPVALQPIPEYARIASPVLTSVLTRMLADPAALTNALDDGFRCMESRQPELAEFIAGELSQVDGPRPQALAYFLAVLVYLAFEEAFGARLSAVARSEVLQTLDRLVTDGELRSGGAAGPSYSEDAIAMGQPALIELLRSEVDRAVEESPQDVGWQHMDAIYETLLVELLVLTQAVAPS